ncbi:MAG: formylmethanofuran dehydrogenase subunit A [Candidatus Baldrarchaeia archaeon]
MMTSLIIKNGYVYDPINGISGEKMDIYVKNGKIVEEFSEKDADIIIDASNMIVMPGGVDIHSHIAGPKVNAGRLLRPEDHRKDPVPRGVTPVSGVGYSIPSTFIEGYRYAIMGWTTVMEPATPPLKTRHTHEELNDIPIIDKGCFPLMDSNWVVLEYLANREFEKLKIFVAWLLSVVKGFAVKIVNPGGMESWGWGQNVKSLDDPVPYFEVTPREIVRGLARVNEELRLPHTIHLHTNNLGIPGNYETTIETMEAVKDITPAEGRKRVIHITHVQFSAYAGDSWRNFASGAADIADYVNKNEHVSIDIGQVIFTDTTTMTADGPFEYTLHKLTRFKWINSDVELETGAGIVPYIYRPKIAVNAVQWCIGLELALLIKDPWRVFLTTDHPNGGPFVYYPQIISWLMSRKAREEVLERAHSAAKKRTTLPDIDREYTFEEIAIFTRAGQARVLGLEKKGHLGIGADADIAIYDIDPKKIDPSKDYKAVIKAFSAAKYTIKDGEIVVKDGKVVKDIRGKTIWVDVQIPEDVLQQIYEEVKEKFMFYYTVNLNNYPIQPTYLHKEEKITLPLY